MSASGIAISCNKTQQAATRASRPWEVELRASNVVTGFGRVVLKREETKLKENQHT
jgi:hypothetical protein